jgi:hypothetical protein
LATPNYGYEKRQKELAKKRKKEDKLKAKAERKPGDPDTGADDSAPAPLDAGTPPSNPAG